MKTALTVIFIIASILLIILVLMQEGKEAGLGSLTGAADSGTYWSKNKGRSKEGTLIKVTTFFTIVFFEQQQSFAQDLFREKISTS